MLAFARGKRFRVRLNQRITSGLIAAIATPAIINAKPVGIGRGNVSAPNMKTKPPIGSATQRNRLRFDFLKRENIPVSINGYY